jgi:hypothetical protein
LGRSRISEALREKGEKISLKDGDQKTLNLTAIRTKDPEPDKP